MSSSIDWFTCPKCGGQAHREQDNRTCEITFGCSTCDWKGEPINRKHKVKSRKYSHTKSRKINTHFPFITSEPRNMKPLEQIFCMVWLAQTCSVDELRAKQDLVEQQIQLAHHPLATEDLLAMQDNLCAAVAYQSFTDHNVWMSFIRLK